MESTTTDSPAAAAASSSEVKPKKKKASVRMKLTFSSPTADEADKTVTARFEDDDRAASAGSSSGKKSVSVNFNRDSGVTISDSRDTKQPKQQQDGGETLDERRAKFKQDEELMRETHKFVAELIEAAKIEAARRAEQKARANGAEAAASSGAKYRGSQTIAGWNNRARGFCNRVWNAVMPCFQNNEVLAWTQPFRYRFSRP